MPETAKPRGRRPWGTLRLRRNEFDQPILDIELARRGLTDIDLERRGIVRMTLHRLRTASLDEPGARTTPEMARRIALAIDKQLADALAEQLFEQIEMEQ